MQMRCHKAIFEQFFKHQDRLLSTSDPSTIIVCRGAISPEYLCTMSDVFRKKIPQSWKQAAVSIMMLFSTLWTSLEGFRNCFWCSHDEGVVESHKIFKVLFMWRNTGEDPTLHTDLMLRALGVECREGIMIQDHREKSTSNSCSLRKWKLFLALVKHKKCFKRLRLCSGWVFRNTFFFQDTLFISR